MPLGIACRELGGAARFSHRRLDARHAVSENRRNQIRQADSRPRAAIRRRSARRGEAAAGVDGFAPAPEAYRRHADRPHGLSPRRHEGRDPAPHHRGRSLFPDDQRGLVGRAA